MNRGSVASPVRIYICKGCSAAFVVPDSDPNAHLLKKSMRCPNHEACGGKVKIYAAGNIKVKGSQHISALQLFQASFGAGLPNEKRCGPKDLRKLLLGSTITEVDLKASSDPQRSLIISLTLGTKVIHFASSTLGATVFKVTEAR
jgi:hypothetical protein